METTELSLSSLMVTLRVQPERLRKIEPYVVAQNSNECCTPTKPACLQDLLRILDAAEVKGDDGVHDVVAGLSFMDDTAQCYAISEYIAQADPNFTIPSIRGYLQAEQGPREHFITSMARSLATLTRPSSLLVTALRTMSFTLVEATHAQSVSLVHKPRDGSHFVYRYRRQKLRFLHGEARQDDTPTVAPWICQTHDFQLVAVPSWTWSNRRFPLGRTRSPFPIVGTDFDSFGPEWSWHPRVAKEHVGFAPGEALPFESLAVLGVGGNGFVDRVRCNGQVLARKQVMCRRKLTTSEVHREIQITKKLQKHRHIVKVIGTYSQGRHLGMLLYPAATCDLEMLFEYLGAWRGATLSEAPSSMPMQDIWQNERALNEGLMGSFGCLANALTYIHACGVKHKDIKPKNILVSKGQIWITDFGISTEFDAGEELSEGPTKRTYNYAAPEVVDQGERGPSSDIFSLGCVYFELMVVILQGSIDGWHDEKDAYAADDSYHANLNIAQRYLNKLLHRQGLLPNVHRRGICGPTLHYMQYEVLHLLRTMMSPDPGRRPTARSIWESFTWSHNRKSGSWCGSCCVDNVLKADEQDEAETILGIVG